MLTKAIAATIEHHWFTLATRANRTNYERYLDNEDENYRPGTRQRDTDRHDRYVSYVCTKYGTSPVGIIARAITQDLP